jgi:hypothetical protein
MYLSFAVNANAQTNVLEGEVNITARAEPIPNNQNKGLYRIDLKYEFIAGGEFSQAANVYIEGLGSVPPKGEFVYLADKPVVIVRESAEGRILVQISLPVPAKIISLAHIMPSPIDVPEESNFPQTYRSGVWSYSASFQKVANTVLNKLFDDGYRAYDKDKVNYLLTTYASLEGLPGNLIAEISVLLSHPYNPGSNKFEYRVQFKVRERRIKSGNWRNELSEETKRVSEKFIKDLLEELQVVGRYSK